MGGCNYQHLENVANEDVLTQIRIFSEHREEDAEEFSHRYDNIRFEMEYPLTDCCNTQCSDREFPFLVRVKI